MSQNKPVNLCFIEDDDAQWKLIDMHLESYDVINPRMNFSTCEAAFEAFQNMPETDLPDVVFIDRQFEYSDLQGEELVAMLRNLPKYVNMGIGVMTADLLDPDMRDRVFKAGAQGLFSKFIEFDDLKDFLRSLGFKIQFMRPIIQQPVHAA